MKSKKNGDKKHSKWWWDQLRWRQRRWHSDEFRKNNNNKIVIWEHKKALGCVAHFFLANIKMRIKEKCIFLSNDNWSKLKIVCQEEKTESLRQQKECINEKMWTTNFWCERLWNWIPQWIREFGAYRHLINSPLMNLVLCVCLFAQYASTESGRERERMPHHFFDEKEFQRWISLCGSASLK